MGASSNPGVPTSHSDPCLVKQLRTAPKPWAVLDCFLGKHKQGAGWELELSGLELAPIWDPGAFKGRTLATRLPHWFQNDLVLKEYEEMDARLVQAHITPYF